ncbi:MAG TPA: guanylate kinase [Candidatus Limnocylindria bacterium]|nr:guanylate kinase [Candidatus Limnocylindria bacterium]
MAQFRKRMPQPKEPGLLIVISGPSGVGKDTILRRLFQLAPELKYSVSYTTRAPRPGEIDGQSYTFVTEDEFKRLIEAKEFLEWAQVYDQYYGTSRKRVEDALARGEDIILKIDVQGAAFVKKRKPDALFIFITPPSTDELLQRLTGRNTESPAALERRQREALVELGLAKDYEHVVCNRDVEESAREILAMIAAEHERRRQRA